MVLFSTTQEMEDYGGKGVENSNGDLEPIFGKDFITAPWNNKNAGKREIIDPKNMFNDKWCYKNIVRGCTNFYNRNNRKLAEYLTAKSAKTIAEETPGNRQFRTGRGGRVGKRTRRTKRLRKTKRR